MPSKTARRSARGVWGPLPAQGSGQIPVIWPKAMGRGTQQHVPGRRRAGRPSRGTGVGPSEGETSPGRWQVRPGFVPPAGERCPSTARRPNLSVHRIQPRERDDRARPSHRGRTRGIIILKGNSSRTKWERFRSSSPSLKRRSRAAGRVDRTRSVRDGWGVSANADVTWGETPPGATRHPPHSLRSGEGDYARLSVRSPIWGLYPQGG